MKNLPLGKLIPFPILKFNLAMKISTLFIFMAIVSVQANSYSQRTKITLNLNDVSVERFLDEIEHSTEFRFVYKTKDVDLQRRISFKCEQRRIDDILREVFGSTNTTFAIAANDRLIHLKERKHDPENGILQKTTSFSNANLQSTITGTVTDANGDPLPGAGVVVKGTTNGTTTDFDGNFSLNVEDQDAVLQISYLGFMTREIAIAGQSQIRIVLQEDSAKLDEVIVTGYSSERKSDLTGAVSVVKIDDVTSQPTASVDNMLQGQVSGVNVVSSGTPGGASSLRIRGFSTIRNNDPLYIIDGVPTTTGINLINPNDIESLQVLKDASSASIYGSRAANGVVIITTKKGNQDEIQVSLDVYTGIQKASKLPKMLSAQDYGKVYWQGFNNDGITPSHDIYGNGATPVIPDFLDAENTVPSADTKWLNEIFNPAVVQSYNMNLSKGSENSNTMFSVGYYDQQGILKFTGFTRVTARLNTEFKIFKDYLTIGENISVARSKRVGTPTNSLLGNAIYDAYRIPSIAPVYNINGDFTGYPLSDVQNPLGKLQRNKDNGQVDFRVFGNVYANLKILEGLNLKTSLGLDHNTQNAETFNPTYREPNSRRDQNDLTVNNNTRADWVWTNTLNYSKTFNDLHDLNIMIGTESVENNYKWTSAYRRDIPSNEPNLWILNAGDLNSQTNAGSKAESSLVSYFGKVNYVYDRKYLVSATVRRDGTSKLDNNRWGTFPAFSLGWRISEESFFNKDGVVSNLKLRYGWGQTGNQDIPVSQTYSGYVSNPYYSNYALDGSQNSTIRGYTLARIANPDLKWETTTQNNIGLDLALWENALTLTADYFDKSTKDLLYARTVSPDNGITNRTFWTNVGEMRNKGFEFAASYQSDRAKDFSFGLDANIAIINNKLVSLGEGINYIETDPAVLHNVNFDQPTSRTSVGQPIASFYGHIVDGVFQSDAEAASSPQPEAVAGDFIFRDINNDNVIDENDRTFIGSPLPDFTYGINFSGKYKNFDFTMFFQGSQGNDIYDLSRYYTDFFSLANYNKSTRVLDAWSSNNTGSGLARVSLNDPNNNIRPSSYYVQNGSYLRLKTLQFGYSLPARIVQNLNVDRIRFYLEAYNLLTFTGYDGLDPEIGLQNYSSDDRNLDLGVDRGIYPASRTFTLGFNFNF